MRHQLQIKNLATLTFIIGILLIIGMSFNTLLAQSTDPALESASTEEDANLSEIDWDEEETSEGGEEAGLSGMNWDEEGESSGEDSSYEAEIKVLEAQDKMVLIKGFLFFSLYILGGVFTAYYTRDRKLAVQYPPELLILLHTFWPLEWLCLTFAGKKVR